MRVFDKISEKLKNRPWYEKLWSRIIITHWMCTSTVRYYILNEPKERKVIDITVDWIKDDIEFGYDAEAIYSKIINGSYNNTPRKEEIK